MNSENEAGCESRLEIETELMHRNSRRAKKWFAAAEVGLFSSAVWLVEAAYRRDISGVWVGIGCLTVSAVSLRNGVVWKRPHVGTVYEGLRNPRR